MADEIKLSISDTHILDICCSIEETCANIYWYFSRLYNDNPEISELWIKTAQEEDSHAEQFRLAYRLKGSGMKSLNIDRYKATTTLKQLESIYENIKNSTPPVKEALRFAVKIEHTLCEFHMNAIADFEDQDLARLFDSMMRNDKEHIQMLEKAYEALCE